MRAQRVNKGIFINMKYKHERDKKDLKDKENKFSRKEISIKFAMWFIVNWEFYDDTDKGQTYKSIYDGKTILPISEIYNRWLLNDV